MTTLAEALATIEAADPGEMLKVTMHRAVSDTDFVAEARRKPPPPSMAGQSPVNAVLIEAKERALALQMERDRLQAAQRAPSREEAVRDLAAGQAPDSVAMVRASISGGAG